MSRSLYSGVVFGVVSAVFMRSVSMYSVLYNWLIRIVKMATKRILRTKASNDDAAPLVRYRTVRCGFPKNGHKCGALRGGMH